MIKVREFVFLDVWVNLHNVVMVANLWVSGEILPTKC